jgi:Na+/proline symporter
MRWKLLIITSITAALVAFCLWEVLIHFTFGSVRPIQPHSGLLLASALVPIGFAAFAGFFVFRHTSRRRKTQAAITMLLTLIVGIGTYVAGSKLYPELLGIPRPCDYPCK